MKVKKLLEKLEYELVVNKAAMECCTRAVARNNNTKSRLGTRNQELVVVVRHLKSFVKE